jgi:hypothetical protein
MEFSPYSRCTIDDVPETAPMICGKFLGRQKVREGREAELSAQERKQIQKGSASIDLDMREDGTFQRQVTEGTWRVDGNKVIFTPNKFGGKTAEEMQRAADEQGRAFGLAFVFNKFELLIDGDCLLSPDESSLIYTEFSRI